MTPFRNTDDERPLTARSVLLSTLLGAHPPSLPVRVLVRSGELFGIAEGTVRVALSRMLAAGEVEQEDGRYRLAGRLLERQARQDESRRPAVRRWRGSWVTAVVTAEGRTASGRVALRSLMRDLRMGELREGVWLRPDNLRLVRPADGQCTWLASRPEGDPAELAARLWDLGAWAARAEVLRERMRRLRIERPDDLAPGFVLSAAVLRHFQADPLLPDELLPVDWPGAALRQEFEAFDAAFLAAWRSFMQRG
ncbi:MAG TPA: PaaX family transcriptional regulator C-terminal domain-containing protein [Acidimicrobiales bacterium]|nr:PaaX family transcriptional regulator C-terminal domain-containing protein [Acidimicrobiales bacterium]